MLSKKFTSIYQSFEITNCKVNLIDRVLSDKNKNFSFNVICFQMFYQHRSPQINIGHPQHVIIVLQSMRLIQT